jgi:hypothetical protein
MASLAEIRQQYPQYNDLSDQDLADRLYQRFYADMPREQFDASLGLQPSGPPMLAEQDAYDPFAGAEAAGLFAEGAPQPELPMMPIGDGSGTYEEEYAPVMPQDAREARDRLVEASDTRSSLQRFREWLDGTVDASQHTVMLGGDDELTRLIFGDDAERQLEESQEQFAEENPGVAMAAEIAGGMGIGAGANRAGATLLRTRTPTPLGMAARGGAEGAAYGGGYGFLDTEGDFNARIKGAGQGAAAGAAFGTPLGAVAGVAARAAARGQTRTHPELQARKSQLYGEAERAGGVVSPSATFDLGLAVRQRLAREQIPLHLLPKSVRRAIRLIDEASLDDLKLGGLDWIRQEARDGSRKPNQRRTLRIIVEEMDRFADNLSPGQMAAGNANAVPIWREARRANVTSERSKIIERAFFRAANKGVRADPGAALAAEFERIANKEPLFDMFSADEQAAILRVARGEGADRLLASYGQIGADGVVNILRTGFGLASGVARGQLARRTRRAAEQAGQTVRSGGVAPPINSTNPLLDALMAGGAIGIQNQYPPLLPGY